MSSALIVANLTDTEFDAFHAARILYTGSTPKGSGFESYGEHAPYIATYKDAVDHTVKALGWENFQITEQEGGAWILRKEAKPRPRPSDNHTQDWVHEEMIRREKANADKDLAALKRRRQREKSQVEDLVIRRDKLQDEVKSLEKQVKRLRQQVDTLEYSTPDFEPREA